MAVSRAEILHLCSLARVDLSDQEVAGLQQDLGQILNYMDLLRQSPQDPIPPSSSTDPPGAPLRADEPTSGLTAEEALRGAAERKESFFVAPTVVDLTRKVEEINPAGGETGQADDIQPDTHDH